MAIDNSYTPIKEWGIEMIQGDIFVATNDIETWIGEVRTEWQDYHNL